MAETGSLHRDETPHHDAIFGNMRTTIDLKPDIHRLAQSVARDRHQTLSETINELLGRVLRPQVAPVTSVSKRTGLRTIRLGRMITADDVRELEDDA